MFADTTLARSLSEDRKRALENLVIVHDFEETRRRHKLLPRPPRCKPQPCRRGSRSSPSALTDAALFMVPTQRVSRA